MGITPEEFRKALGYFATGVTVVTVARGEGSVHGMTANAFSSVSLEPPLILVCVEHSARTYPLLQQCQSFGVNVLHEGQQAVARYFADADQDHETRVPAGVDYCWSERGTPLLRDCLVQLDCTLADSHKAGDHTVFFGEVSRAEVREGRPLLFHRGQFCQLEDHAR